MTPDLLVLDSWPVMEWLKGREPATSRFEHLLARAKSGNLDLLISSINLGEIYYNCWSEWGETRSEEVVSDLHASPVHVLHPGQEDVMAAARIKARYKCSYADAFAVVLASSFQSPIVTGDRDFIKMRDGQAAQIEWWGA